MIVISSGHSKYCRGASSILDEVDEARKIVERVADYLQAISFDIIIFHDDVSTSQSENLDRIVNFHNSQTRDLDVSVHLNCYDGSAHGTECLYVTQEDLADEMSAAIAEAGGFTNRGPKKRTDLAFLNGTDEPAILLEICFVDSQIDADLYHEHFEDICRAIAGVLSDQEIPPIEPPQEPDRPVLPRPPEDVPLEDRPTLERGDEGKDVEDLQRMLPDFEGAIDGDFGPMTEDAVMDYQRSRGLDIDGIVGPQTWAALYEDKPPIPPPPPVMSIEDQRAIIVIAKNSAIATYNWRDRGQAPEGYTTGMALTFAQSYRRLKANHPSVIEMAKANTHDDDVDALSWYDDEFDELDMDNESDGIDTLRHLFVMLMGLGMRESSGRHCEGRDMSASNVTSDTAEAGLFQTSWNAHNCSDEFDRLFYEFSNPSNQGGCFTEVFSVDVSCSSSDWENYGSGDGEAFQHLCKNCPAFAVESCGIGLRNLRQHWGPINRKEAELRREADDMLLAVQRYVDEMEGPVSV